MKEYVAWVKAHPKDGSFGSAGLGGVPTLIEQGFNVDTGDAWTGMWAPAKTPKAELDRMQAALRKVLALPDVRDILMTKQTLLPDFRPAEELGALQRKELAYWGPVIKASGFKPDQ